MFIELFVDIQTGSFKEPGIVMIYIVVLLVLISLLLRHRGKSPDVLSLQDLVRNKYGKVDIAAMTLIIGIYTMTWVLLFCTIRGKAPEGLAVIYTTFAASIVIPLTAKIIFKAKEMPDMEKMFNMFKLLEGKAKSKPDKEKDKDKEDKDE